MTEQEWLAGTDPTSMVLLLKGTSSHWTPLEYLLETLATAA